MMMDKNKEIATSIGFVSFYGNSPALNLLKESKFAEKEEIKILLNGNCDLRHALKTITDNVLKPKNLKKISFYIHEKHHEVIARSILMTEIVNNSDVSYRERVELFFDIYWNNFVRDKTVEYLDQRIKELENVVCDQEKCKLGIKHLWKFKNFKYKDQDNLVDIFRRWKSKAPFDMEKYRDDRLRFLYQDRYDFRKNLYDWDYIWGLKPLAPIIHPREYKGWRHDGIAFEIRTTTYTKPNRTMSGFVDGHRKTNRNSCIVLGYWGDIILSPYMTMGVATDSEPEKTKLFRKRNLQFLHLSQHVAEFNAYSMIYILERMEEYHLDWEGEDQKKKDEAKKRYEEKKAKEKTLEVIEEVEGGNEEEDEEGKTPETKEVEKIEKARPNARQKLITLDQPEDEEGDEEEEESPFVDELVPGFKGIEIEFLPVSENLEKMAKKKKYKGLFDIVCNGFKHAMEIREEWFLNVLHNGSEVIQENCHFMIPLQLEKRKDANKKMMELAVNSLEVVEFYDPSQFKFVAKKDE